MSSDGSGGIVSTSLKAAAKAHRRSLQAEIHDALAQASARCLAETRRLSFPDLAASIELLDVHVLAGAGGLVGRAA